MALVGGLAISAVAQAQQTGTNTPQQLQRVEVTGSNIKRVDAETVAPVQVITREDIVRSGQPTIADVLKNLPSNTGGFGENFTNSFAPGANSISLRGLGQKTTLVLINGRRTANYGFAQNLQDSFVDLNSIPTAAVERIEILKDGASAIYGSDAIAGVVNVILRRDYRGADGNVSYARTARDKSEYGASISAGFGDLGSNKFNVFGVLDYYHRDLIMMKDTDFGATRDMRSYQGGRNFTSLTGNGTWRQVAANGTTLTNNYRATASCGGEEITGPEAIARGLTTSAAVGAATNTFCNKDYNDQFTSTPETDRIGFLSRGTWEISPSFTAYAELGLSRTEAKQKFQAPFFAGTTGLENTAAGLRPFVYNINFAPGVAGNPFTTGFGRYNGVFEDMGTRDSEITSDSARVLVGANYTVAGWDFDSGLGYAKNKVVQTNINRITLSGTSAVFGVPTTPPVGGLFPTSTATAYNLNDTSGNSQAVRDQMLINFDRKATSTLMFIDTRASTELQNVRLPGGPLGVGIGAEHRREKLKDDPDPVATSGDILGQGITATDGSRNSTALFAELRLPILKTLEGQVAVRYDHYSDYGSSTTPKLGLKWTVTPQLAVRANWGKGFRAPTLPEISPSQATFFTSVIDPETDTAVNISGVYAGNPNLQAEKSKSTNIGIIFEPMKDFSVSLDYYRIDWRNVVASPSFQDVVDASCPGGGTAAGNAPCPSTPNIIRDPSTNQVVTIYSGYENLASRVTSGYDIDLRYAVPTTTFGKFTTSVDLTYIRSFKEDGVECVGRNGCSNTIPRMKYGATLGWDYGAVSLTGRVNYIKGWTQDGLAASYYTPQSPAFQNGVYPNKTPSYATLDLYGSYQITKSLKAALSVTNALDKKPPYDPGFSSTFLYDFSQFDARGRTIRGTLSYAMN